MSFGTPLRWRETHRQPLLLIFDARLILLVLLMLFYIRIWTIALTVVTMIVLFFFARKKVGADDILRFIRARIAGRRRTAMGMAAERMPVDFGFETAADVERARLHTERVMASLEKKALALQKKRASRAGRPRT